MNVLKPMSISTQVSSEGKNSDFKSHKKWIRIRFSFKKQPFRGSDGEYIRQVIYEMMQCSKIIDANSALLPWKGDADVNSMNGDEVKLIPADLIKDYIDVPPVKGTAYMDGMMYYGNGIRIRTEMDIDEYISRWTYKRYDKEENSLFKNWKAVKTAEVQSFINPTPIGYLSGTTENGYYDTIKDGIRKEFKNEIEVSFQTVYQPGVLQRVWNSATKMAKQVNADPNSREHRRVKFGMPPTALIVYAKNQDNAGQLCRQFIKKYREIKKDSWPKMHDNSRMRFIPITNSYIQEKEYRDSLYESLHHQAASKAGEVMLELDLVNLREKRLPKRRIARADNPLH